MRNSLIILAMMLLLSGCYVKAERFEICTTSCEPYNGLSHVWLDGECVCNNRTRIITEGQNAE